ncbi:hypothetical protein JCM6882_005922 [Rhodosporidiobolus microsporus]
MPDDPLHSRLLADFCPPLDSALVLALLSDYPSPLTPSDESSARQTLASLAADAEGTDPDFTEVGIAAGWETGERGQGKSGDRSAGVSVSELSSQLEASSLSEGSARSADAEEGTAGRGDALAAGQAFWAKSGASLTSEEDAHGAGKFVWDIPDDFVDALPLPLDGDIGDDPLAFLASVFPDMDLAVLEKKLATTPYADGTPAPPVDLEQLVEELLSEDLITSLMEDDAKAASDAAAGSLSMAQRLGKQEKRRVKAAQKANNSFSLTSTPHLAHPSAAAASSTAASSDLSTSALFTASATSNAWASISSHASYLSTLLRIPASRITSTYYQNSSSLPATLSVLLTQLAHDRPFSSLASSASLKAQLSALLPSPALDLSRSAGAKEDELEALLCATEGDVSDALDLHAFVADVQRSMGKNLAWSVLVARDAPAAGSAEVGKHTGGGGDGFTTVSNGRRRSPDLARGALPPSSAPSSAHSSSSHLPLYVSSSSDPRSAEECRALAASFLERRNAAFREAAKAFQRGHGRGVGERGGATVWAEKGRVYERERRRWEEEAARRTVGERRAITGHNVIDLHGLTLSQALTAVDEACNTWWSSSREAFSPPPLRIITGVGRHSRNQRAVLAPAVTKHLDKAGWRWKWDDGPLVAGGLPLRAMGGPEGQGRGAVKVIGVR